MKTKIKNLTRILFVFLTLPLIVASLWPHDVMALSGFNGNVVDFQRYPYWDFCAKLDLNQCSWSPANQGWSGYFNSVSTKYWQKIYASSSPYNNISVKKGTIASLTFSLHSAEVADISYPHITSSGETVLTIGYEKSNPASTYEGEYTVYVYFTRDYKNEPYVVQFPISVGQYGSSEYKIDDITYYETSASELDITNQTLSDIKSLLEDIKQNSGDNGTTERIDDARDEAEDAQNQAQTDGSTSQTDATTDGQTLLQAFQSFVNALTSASPSNCNIPMDTGYINFGSVNLCSLNPPPAFQAISSIVVIGFAVPLSIACARKIIDLFRSFQT